MTSGEERGYVLWPVLRLLYVDAYLHDLLYNAAMFSDNVKRLQKIKCPLDVRRTENDIHRLSNWPQMVLMGLNTVNLVVLRLHFLQTNVSEV